MTPLDLPATSWLNAPAHSNWRQAEAHRLLAFAKAAKLPDGFGNLDAKGQLAPGARAQTMNTARMTHCFALAHLQGVPGYLAYAEHGVTALRGAMQDARYGGWFAHPGGHDDSGKAAYLHAFVALAASSAVVAGVDDAPALLADAAQVLESHFWCEGEGALRETLSRAWQLPEPYRGANSNMHATEAFLALADVTRNTLWLQRALRIAERIIHTHAAANGHRVIEHFDALWQPLPHYNQEHPADHFRPYGTTPGHALEWARLLLHLEASLAQAGLHAPDWLLGSARALFDGACGQAWHADGAPGFVYTLDWADRPVVHARLHWVHAEACAAAAALLQRTGEAHYEQWYRRCWDFIANHFIDHTAGSWHHELDALNQPAGSIWPGKPDLYHACQALLLPGLPLAPSLASALAGNVTR
ncbi:AGE family epimerase/isomerase [Pseudomonas sp. CM27]|uniref:D-mannose isomerase n=1 Tax=Pseudomonas sp. CM27 TaxID=2738452 RepID=UPI0015574FC9|nr:AGE family epimerase/isomerase [Pseudomonas sp. CM27]NQD76297.1 AGE family epimerase/isomerase [Pseudomonas sp. CM27]HEN8802483.1 AGE family epimerase/isomerase [Pseudomonas putida]